MVMMMAGMTEAMAEAMAEECNSICDIPDPSGQIHFYSNIVLRAS
jgi:hypothetical protein